MDCSLGLNSRPKKLVMLVKVEHLDSTSPRLNSDKSTAGNTGAKMSKVKLRPGPVTSSNTLQAL